MSVFKQSTNDRTPPTTGTDDRRAQQDDRPDFGLFGRAVSVLIVGLLVAAVVVAVLIDPLVWVLAALLLGTLVLWSCASG